jgi:hypothetical protein
MGKDFGYDNSFDSWKGTFFCDHQWYVESGNSYEAFDPELVELVVGRYWLFLFNIA